MSGTMMAQQGAPPQGPPQIPPQLLQMLMAQQQQQRGVPQMPMGGPPGGMPPGMPMPPGGPPGAPPQAAQPMSQVPPMPMPQGPQQNLQAFGRMAQGGPGGQQPRLTPQEMAHLGRFGDAVMAHLTPGEVAVPPEVQTPQVKRDLAHAFQHVGVNPANFVAGSPTSSINPNTGAPEYSLWSSLLPVLGTIGGAALAPYTGGLSVPAGMAIGGALGGAAGGLVDHGSAAQIALQAAGGGAGGYLGGAMGGAGSALEGAAGSAASGATTGAAGLMGDSAQAAGQAAASGANFAGAAVPDALSGTAAAGSPATLAGASGNIGSQASNLSTFGNMVKNLPWKSGMLAGTGASIGGMLAPQPTQAPYSPPGFNTPMGALNHNPNALWGRPNQSPTPQFAGYSPQASVTGQPYNFFPNS